MQSEAQRGDLFRRVKIESEPMFSCYFFEVGAKVIVIQVLNSRLVSGPLSECPFK